MHQFNKFKNTHGFIANYSYFLRIQSVDEEAKKRVRIINHLNHYGLESTKDAFGVSKASIYRWKKLLENNPRNLKVLNKKSTRPNTCNKRIPEKGIEEAIVVLRKKYLRMGAKPLTTLLHKQGFRSSHATVGRILKDLKDRNRLPIRALPTYKKKKVKKERRKEKAGYEIDSVVRHINGLKWYFVTAINIQTRKVSVHVSLRHTSQEATRIITTLDNPSCIQTDNGSEFLKDFHSFCVKKHIPHYFTYPYTPKMNAFVERFNRTLEYEFISLNRRLLLSKDSLPKLKIALEEYVTFYNTVRPHSSLGFLSPLEYSKRQESQMC